MGAAGAGLDGASNPRSVGAERGVHWRRGALRYGLKDRPAAAAPIARNMKMILRLDSYRLAVEGRKVFGVALCDTLSQGVTKRPGGHIIQSL